MPGIRPGTSGSVGRISDYTTEAVGQDNSKYKHKEENAICDKEMKTMQAK
jgi:hypothetical protein